MGQEPNPIYRWKEWDPGGQIQSVLFDLTSDDNAHARRIRDSAYANKWETFVEIVDNERPAFDRINALLAATGLSVNIKNVAGEEIIAQHEATGTSYSIAQMSDGERNAVIIAANVLTAKPHTVLLIDEPERHLHRAITEPFLSALFAERPDCAFVISTHEVTLPLANPAAHVLMIRSCQWNNDIPHTWDAKLLNQDSDLPEGLKRAILGSRKTILFVEGKPQSLDQRLYSALFPNITVRATGSCNDVIQAVKGVRQTASSHDIKAFGLIDRDDRDKSEIAKLADDGIYALDAYSVESLYYCSDLIEAVAYRQAMTFNSDPRAMVQEAKCKALDALAQNNIAENMAALLCTRKVKEQFLRKIPGKHAVMSNANGEITLTVKSPYCVELDRFKEMLNNKDLDAIVARYPVRQSAIRREIAEALRLRTASDYEQTALARILDDQTLADKLKQRIAPLTEAINAHLKQ